MSMARFFTAAFRRLGHEVITVGPYSGDDGSIPWPGQPKFPQYIDKPTIPLPESLSSFPLAALKTQLPGDIDLVFSFDAGFRLTGKLDGIPSILYGTDPHAIDYRPYISEYDFFFCAQNFVWNQPLPEGAVWVPLAYDPTVHIKQNPISDEDRPVDVVFIGVMGNGPGNDNAYAKRWRAVQALKEKFQTFAIQGMIFRECTEAYNRGKIGFNWSSQNDLPMRIWENAAYGNCVVTNKLPLLEEVGFVDGKTCIVYETQDELLEKVEQAITTGSWRKIARAGNVMVHPHTYDARVQTMLEAIGVS